MDPGIKNKIDPNRPITKSVETRFWSLTTRINEILQAFERNNRILLDNWKDEQSVRFSQEYLASISGIMKQFEQYLEVEKKSLCAIVDQLEGMERELKKMDHDYENESSSIGSMLKDDEYHK